MTRPSRAQLSYAVLLSPPVAPAVYFVGMMTYTLVRASKGVTPPLTSRDMREVAGACAIIGGAYAYVAMLAALPFVLWLRHIGRLTRGTLIALGSITGAVASVVLAHQLRGGMFSSPLPWWMGSVIGVLCAVVFWTVAGGRRAPNLAVAP